MGGVLRIHADAVDELEVAAAGDVVALSGLEATGCGDTLAEEGATEASIAPARTGLGVRASARRGAKRDGGRRTF